MIGHRRDAKAGRFGKPQLWIPLLAIAASASACVPKDAGYNDVRNMVSRRTHADVRYRHVDSTDTAKQVKELLEKPLSDRDAVQIALLNNPDVQASFEDLGVARARLVHALRLPNPHGEAAVRYHGDSKPELDLSVTLDVSQLLFMPYRKGVADADLNAAKIETTGRILDTVLAVRRAYFELLAAQQGVEMRRKVIMASNAAYATARRLHDAGNITDLDLLTEKAQYDEARLAAARAEFAVVRSRERLQNLMGAFGAQANWTTMARLADVPERDPVASEKDALRVSLDLAAIHARYAAAGGRANLARVEGWLPSVRGGVTAERAETNWSLGPVVELEVPLFYQGQGRVGEAEAEWRRQQHMYGSIALKIRSALRTATQNLSSARATALHYKDVLLPLRARIVHETQLGYNAMGIGVFQLIQARRDEIETGRAYVEAQRDYWTARAELEQLMSGRLVEVTAVSGPGMVSAPSADGGGH